MRTVTVEWAGTAVDGTHKSGTVDVQVPETVDEALDTWGADRLLDLAARQAITDARNKARAQACGRRESETAQLLRALLKQAKSDPALLELLKAQAGLEA